MVNLRALSTLLEEAPSTLWEEAKRQSFDPVIVIGTAKLLIANDGNLRTLSLIQRQGYDHVIEPLLRRWSSGS